MVYENFLSQRAKSNLNFRMSTSLKEIFNNASSNSSFSTSLIRPSAKISFTKPSVVADEILSASFNRGYARGAAGNEGISLIIWIKFYKVNSICSGFSCKVKLVMAVLYRIGAF